MHRADENRGRPGRRRGLLAGGTLGLAGAAAAAVVGLAGHGTAAPAQAAVQHQGGSVVVHLVAGESLNQAWNQLAKKGIHDQFTINSKPGPAKVHSPISCKVAKGAHPKGPRIRVIEGTRNEVTSNSGRGGVKTYHIVSCTYFQSGFTSGNSGAH